MKLLLLFVLINIVNGFYLPPIYSTGNITLINKTNNDKLWFVDGDAYLLNQSLIDNFIINGSFYINLPYIVDIYNVYLEISQNLYIYSDLYYPKYKGQRQINFYVSRNIHINASIKSKDLIPLACSNGSVDIKLPVYNLIHIYHTPKCNNIISIIEILNETKKSGIKINIDNTLLIIIVMFIVVFLLFAFVLIYYSFDNLYFMIAKYIQSKIDKHKKNEYIELT